MKAQRLDLETASYDDIVLECGRLGLVLWNKARVTKKSILIEILRKNYAFEAEAEKVRKELGTTEVKTEKTEKTAKAKTEKIAVPTVPMNSLSLGSICYSVGDRKFETPNIVVAIKTNDTGEVVAMTFRKPDGSESTVKSQSWLKGGVVVK